MLLDSGSRLLAIFLLLPLRLQRFAMHFWKPQMRADAAYAGFSPGLICVFWLLELLLLLFEAAGLAEGYEVLAGLFKFRTRKLSAEEILVAKSVFGDALPYQRIRIDESAHLGPRQGRFCYVSFHTLNSWGPIPAPLLIHELTHVWQYLHLGIRYIPRALAAQRTASGYNYGGEAGLERAIASGRGLAFFNLEQQADLIEDYYRLQNGLPATWNRQATPRPELYELVLGGIVNR